MNIIRTARTFLFLALVTCSGLLLAQPSDFMDEVDRVGKALKTNPSNVLQQSLEACLRQRNFAVKLYQMGEEARALRSLKFCYGALQIPETAVAEKVSAPSVDALREAAEKEFELASKLTPDVANGLKVYRECAACHQPEGWGMTGGSVPQIAGQHQNVVIKQLADIRAGNRDSVMMAPYASAETIGGAQAVADVAAYIDTLEISIANGKGPGDDLELGEQLYAENCVACHGKGGEGQNDLSAPRIQAQHYRYLVRQFEWIRDGKRRNSNPEMLAQILDFSDREMYAVLDYVSRLLPPEVLRAPEGWKNPDFN